jgi:hypothetical protein
VPEPLGGLVVDAFSEPIADNPDQFPRMEPRLQRFETGNLLDHRHGDSGRFLFWDDHDIVQEQAEHAPVLEATPELPHGFGAGPEVWSCVYDNQLDSYLYTPTPRYCPALTEPCP